MSDWIPDKDNTELENAILGMHTTIATLTEENAKLENAYGELIMAVAKKFPNETRHQTALRYIMERELPQDNGAKQDKP